MNSERKTPTENKEVHENSSTPSAARTTSAPDLNSTEFPFPFQKPPSNKVHVALQMKVNLFYLEKLRTVLNLSDAADRLEQLTQFVNGLALPSLHDRITHLLHTMEFKTSTEGICVGLTMKMVEAHQSDKEKKDNPQPSMYQLATNRLNYFRQLLELEKTNLQFVDLFRSIDSTQSQLTEESEAKKADQLDKICHVQLRRLNLLIHEKEKMLKQFLLKFSSKELEDLENYQTDILAYCNDVAFLQSVNEHEEVVSKYVIQSEPHKVSSVAQSQFYEDQTEQEICALIAEHLVKVLPGKMSFNIENFQQENHARLAAELNQLTQMKTEITHENDLILIIKKLRSLVNFYKKTEYVITINLLGNIISIQNTPNLASKDQTTWKFKRLAQPNTVSTPLPFANYSSGLAFVDKFGGVSTKTEILQFLQRLDQLAIWAKSENFSVTIDSFHHRIALCYRATIPPTWRFIDVNKPTLFEKEYQFHELDQIASEIMTSIPANVEDHPDKRALSFTVLTNPSNLVNARKIMEQMRPLKEFTTIHAFENEYVFLDNRRINDPTLLNFSALIYESHDLDMLKNFIDFYITGSLSRQEKERKIQNLIANVLTPCITWRNTHLLQDIFHLIDHLKVVIQHENRANEAFITKIYSMCIQNNLNRKKLSVKQFDLIELVLKRPKFKPAVAPLLLSLITHEHSLPAIKIVMTQHFPLEKDNNKLAILKDVLEKSCTLPNSPHRAAINDYLQSTMNSLLPPVKLSPRPALRELSSFENKASQSPQSFLRKLPSQKSPVVVTNQIYKKKIV